MTEPNQTKTPRTDANTYGETGTVGSEYVSADFARQLETELAEAKKCINEIQNNALESAAHMLDMAAGEMFGDGKTFHYCASEVRKLKNAARKEQV